jgi:hypothetical protein
MGSKPKLDSKDKKHPWYKEDAAAVPTDQEKEKMKFLYSTIAEMCENQTAWKIGYYALIMALVNHCRLLWRPERMKDWLEVITNDLCIFTQNARERVVEKVKERPN